MSQQTMPPPPADADIVNQRMTNGYGITTSMYSVTAVGHADFSTKATNGRVQEKACVLNKRFHNPSRKNLHMQTAYPETVAKLQPLRGDLTRATTPPQLKERDPAKRKTRGEERQIPFEETNPEETRTRHGLTVRTKGEREGNKKHMNECHIEFSAAPHYSPRGRPTEVPWGTALNGQPSRAPPPRRPAPYAYD